jgi:hypothetical protein
VQEGGSDKGSCEYSSRILQGMAHMTAFFGRFSSPSSAADGLLDAERQSNRLLLAVKEDSHLREVLLRAATSDAAGTGSSGALHLLLPQNVTLDDVRMTRELLETHLVLLHSDVRGTPRPFTSLNGLCGTCLADGAITVHGRLRRAADMDSALGGSVGGWEQRGRSTSVPQLESQIFVLREGALPPSARLQLQKPIGLMLISDPLFYPGCGWKLPLALRRCTHRFANADLDELPLADLPQLLFEYQILARAWAEQTATFDEQAADVGDDGGAAWGLRGGESEDAAAGVRTPERPGRAAGSYASYAKSAASAAAAAVATKASPSAAALLSSLLGGVGGSTTTSSTSILAPAGPLPATAKPAAAKTEDIRLGSEPLSPPAERL